MTRWFSSNISMSSSKSLSHFAGKFTVASTEHTIMKVHGSLQEKPQPMYAVKKLRGNNFLLSATGGGTLHSFDRTTNDDLYSMDLEGHFGEYMAPREVEVEISEEPEQQEWKPSREDGWKRGTWWPRPRSWIVEQH
jgi:hypothetical protein